MIFTKNKAILVTGGAGYIGSHIAYELYKQGYFVIVLDAFLHKQIIPTNWGLVIREDSGNRLFLDKLFSTYTIDAVIHLAAFIEVGESVKDPAPFYHNNVVKSLQLFDAMKAHGIKRCIFSSSCAVYGVPQTAMINEEHPLSPYNPYGKTKLAIEYALQDYAAAYGFNAVILRYFNAAGALPEARIGEQHSHETHIIPLLLRAALDGREFFIFGNNYETPDGTCIRDYIHVRDIALAHTKAYDYLCSVQPLCEIFNLGTGQGHSIKELIEIAEQVTGKQIPITVHPRREGDVPRLVADSRKAYELLCWRPQYSDMHTILSSAYTWELDQKKRFSSVGTVTFEKRERAQV